jgi:hypothetical protein
MSDTTQLTTHELWVDGRQITVTAVKTASTRIRVSWTLPANPKAYSGAVVLLSEEKFSSLNFPEDGRRYAASSDWSNPADQIGSAKVVSAFYGYFGDDVNQTSVEVDNVDPNKIYYASIHAASSVLQYYTIGSQSYPLESSRFEKQSETYAGSIPKHTTPPNNPYNGQAYYDSSINAVLVWNESLSAWVESNQKNIPVGKLPPILKNQIFYNTIDRSLRFFDGSQWVDADSSNLRVKMASTWVPYRSAESVAALPQNPSAGDVVHLTIKPAVSAPITNELKVYTMGAWFNVTPDLMQIGVVRAGGGDWESISLGEPLVGEFNPSIPNVGDFFYQSSTRDLLAWSGDQWIKVDIDNEGSPSTDKIGIGTDGSYDERLRLIKVLKHQMGYPQVCAELTEEQFNIAIDNALDEFRRRADNAYANKYLSFTIKRGQSVYYLNDPRDGTDKIVNVIKIHRINHLGISSLSAETGLYAQAFFNQLYQGSNVDVISIHLMNQLSETYERVFAGNLTFVWDEPSRQLTILRRINVAEERVILEVASERSEQELLYDRWCKQWLQGWAQSEVMEMLGEIRSKYGTLPGPNGGITLNGPELLSRSAELQTELLRQIADYEVGNGGVGFGNATFLIG